jgi:Rod binding domain-containing protein
MSSITAINASTSAWRSAALQTQQPDFLTTGVKTSKQADSSRDPVAIKKAAGQFEAIILRQLLAPAVEPVMSGGLGGEKSSGGSIYGYMLTDTLANSMAQAGGLGLGRMLEKQLTPRGVKTDIGNVGNSSAQNTNSVTKLP